MRAEEHRRRAVVRVFKAEPWLAVGVLCAAPSGGPQSSYLELAREAGGAMDDLIGHSITYRVAVGPRAGQKVFALQSVPARPEEPKQGVAQYAGFSLHAGIGVEPDQLEKLERLTRHVNRPPVSIVRLDLTAQLLVAGLVVFAAGVGRYRIPCDGSSRSAA